VITLLRVLALGYGCLKLGITSRSVEARYMDAAREVLFEATLYELDALRLEQHLHAKYEKCRDHRVCFAGMRQGARRGGYELYVAGGTRLHTKGYRFAYVESTPRRKRD
jgi:hypothetical protein